MNIFTTSSLTLCTERSTDLQVSAKQSQDYFYKHASPAPRCTWIIMVQVDGIGISFYYHNIYANWSADTPWHTCSRWKK